MKKLKILWICHFTNDNVQSRIPIWRKSNEFASWIPNMLKGFENRDDFEIHVISPHNYLRRQASFTENNIHYYFIPYGIPLIHHHWPSFFRFDAYTNFASWRRKAKKLVNRIDPVIISLIGAENAHYSSAILDINDKYPILIAIQGFISQMKDSVKMTVEMKSRIRTDEKILRKFKHFAGEQDSSTYISLFNANHKFFRLYFPINESLANQIVEQEKKFDCIYYGRLSQLKGTEDFIKVIAELKIVKTDIKACIVGPGNPDRFINIANQLGCLQNIEFAGFMENQEKLFILVKSSRVFLTPPYFERLSSTIREAMYLKVPIVAYATGGIPYINEFDENIIMVETGDYKSMAKKTIQLLENKAECEALAQKAYQYALNEYSLTVNTARLLDAYKEILNIKK
jgi:glycosyltransferase involved in cell wall biosynthesis